MGKALLIVLIIVLITLVLSVTIILIVSLASGKKNNPSEIHYSGGANIDDGRISSDSNYFKGMSVAVEKTVVVYENRRATSDFGMRIVIRNKYTGQKDELMVRKQLVFGRSDGNDVYVVDDKAASRSHCMLTVKNRRFFLTDLNSSNHTYLNGRQINSETEVFSGDELRVGNTRFELTW